MARPLLPMHPTLIARPFHRDGWVYEEKVDGYRILAHKAADRVRLISRHAKNLTARFPELAAAIARLAPETLVLDGEVAVYDERRVSRFEWMRRSPRDAVASPPIFMVFDLLQLEGQDVRHEPLRIRRERRYARRGAPDPPPSRSRAQGVAAGTRARVGGLGRERPGVVLRRRAIA
jgi:bifunctional non-homologous end joining protein LigD